MNRRTFMGPLPLSAASLSWSLPLSPGPPADTEDTAAEAAAASLPPGVSYFTEERLEQLVNTNLPLQRIRFQTVAYNFPNYHPSPAQEKYFGKGWTEWQVLERANPLFPGHLQPTYPQHSQRVQSS